MTGSSFHSLRRGASGILCALLLGLSAGCETPTELPPPPQADAPGTISGQLQEAVTGTNELVPAAGARIQILSTSLVTTAGSDGRFLLKSVTETVGKLLIQADPDSSGTYQRQRLFDLATIGAGPGQQVSLGNVELDQNAAVSGTVLLSDQLGAMTGLGGTAVFVPEGPFTTYTSDNGSFVLDNLPEGAITLTFFRTGYQPQGVAGINLSSGQELQLTNTVLVPQSTQSDTTGTISGQLLFIPPVSNIAATQVLAIGAGAEAPVTVMSNGTYSAVLPVGIYTLEFSYPGYTDLAVPNVLAIAGMTSTVPLTVMTPAPPGTDVGFPALDAGFTMSDAGPSTPDAGPSTPDASTPDAGPSTPDAGPSTPDAGPSTPDAGPSTPDAGPSTPDGGPSTPDAGPTTSDAGPSIPDAGSTTGDGGIPDGGASGGDAGTLAIPPTARVVTLGAVAVGAMFKLDGSESQAPEAPAGLFLSYAWVQTMGDAVTLSENNSAAAGRPVFTAPATIQTLAFMLTVTDTRTGLSGSTTTTIDVIKPPVATITPMLLQVYAGAAAQFDGSLSSDPTGNALTYAWSSPSLTIGASTGSSISFTAPMTAGTYSVELIASDPFASSAAATASLQVLSAGVAPSVTTSPDQTVPGGTLVQLGAAATTPDTVGWSWAQTAGSTISLSDANTATPSFTAPFVAGTLSFQVTVTTTHGTATATENVEVQLIPPTVTTPANLTTQPHATVQLVATGTAPNPIAYSWVQVSGTPVVALTGGTSATATFTAPQFYAYLGFTVTATTPAGSATASVHVTVNDTTAPTIVRSDPPSDNSLGPWLTLSAVFSKPLDPVSVTGTNIVLHDTGGTVIAGNVTYDVPSQTMRFTPLVPLIPGTGYSWTIGAVQDLAPTPNIHASEVLHFQARPRNWTTWSGTDLLTAPPSPGIAANDSEVDLFVTYANASCNGFTARLSPGANGVLDIESPCYGSTNTNPQNTLFNRRGFNVGGDLYGIDLLTWAYGDIAMEREEAGAFTTIAQPSIHPDQSFFTDGSALYALTYNPQEVGLQAYAPGLDTWLPSSPEPLYGLCGNYGSNFDGTGGNGNLFVILTDPNCNFARPEFYVEELTGGTWSAVAGPVGDGGLATWSAADPGTAQPRATFAAGAPFFAWSNTEALDVIHGAVLDSSQSTPVWDLFTGLNENGSSAIFDIRGWGNVVFFAYVTNGLLYLRQIDLTNLASPVFTDIPGPTGPSLNISASCLASHPELATVDGGLYLTWGESCASGAYTVQLRELQ